MACTRSKMQGCKRPSANKAASWSPFQRWCLWTACICSRRGSVRTAVVYVLLVYVLEKTGTVSGRRANLSTTTQNCTTYHSLPMATLYPAETNSGSVTSYVPLTTVFTPPAGCSNSYRLDGPSLMAFDPGYGLNVNPSVVCQPPAVTTWWEQGLLGAGNTAASLGPMTCPQDWKTVVTSAKNQFSTLAMCCPPGYHLAFGEPGKIAGDCLSDVSPGMTLTYASTPMYESTAWTIVTTTLTASSFVGAIAVVGWNINERVLVPTSISPTSTGTSSATGPGTSSTTSGTGTTTGPTKATGNGTATGPITSAPRPPVAESTSSTSSSSSSPPFDSLPTAAKVGIGVGIAVGVLGLLALVLSYIFLKRRNKPSSPDPSPAMVGQQPPPPYRPVSVPKRATNVGAYEVWNPPAEMDGGYGNGPRYELF